MDAICSLMSYMDRLPSELGELTFVQFFAYQRHLSKQNDESRRDGGGSTAKPGTMKIPASQAMALLKEKKALKKGML